MYKDKQVTAIITAAGKGSRMGASLPKQFLKIGNKTILEKAILPFEKAECIDHILVVSGAEEKEVVYITSVVEHVEQLISSGMDKKTAIAEVAKLRKIPKRNVYNEYENR